MWLRVQQLHTKKQNTGWNIPTSTKPSATILPRITTLVNSLQRAIIDTKSCIQLYIHALLAKLKCQLPYDMIMITHTVHVLHMHVCQTSYTVQVCVIGCVCVLFAGWGREHRRTARMNHNVGTSPTPSCCVYYMHCTYMYAYYSSWSSNYYADHTTAYISIH